MLIASIIKLSDDGPIFFKQTRIGLGGRPFQCFKFRTLSTKHEVTLDKPNMIWGGEFIRTHGLDELPELLNVIRGDMSLVGPRPDVLQLEDYEQWYKDRFKVLPGITGLWQVSGKNTCTFSEMVHLDIEYVQKRSILLDIRILFKTLSAVFLDPVIQQLRGMTTRTAAEDDASTTKETQDHFADALFGKTPPSFVVTAQDAFERDLPALLRRHEQKWVLYHFDRQVAVHRNYEKLLLICKQQGINADECLIFRIEHTPQADDVEVLTPANCF